MEEQNQTQSQKTNDTRRQILQTVFLIVIMIAIGVLISAIISIVKYADMLKNPIGYNMDKFGLNYCTCYDKNNLPVPIRSTNYSNISDSVLFVPESKNFTFKLPIE